MRGRAAAPASTSSPVRSEVIEAKPKSKPNPIRVACAGAIVDNPGTRACATVSRSDLKPDGFADQLQQSAEPEGIDHSLLINSETRARSLDALQWGLIPYWAKTQTCLSDHRLPSRNLSFQSLNRGSCKQICESILRIERFFRSSGKCKSIKGIERYNIPSLQREIFQALAH